MLVASPDPGLDGKVEVHAEVEVEVAVAARDRPVAESHQPLVVFGVENSRQGSRPATLGVLQEVIPVVATDEGVETAFHVREVEAGAKTQVVLEPVVLVPDHSNEGAPVCRFQLLVQAVVAEEVVEPQGCLAGRAVQAAVQPVDPRSSLQVLGSAGIGLLRGGVGGVGFRTGQRIALRLLAGRGGADQHPQTDQRRPSERRERRGTLVHGLVASSWHGARNPQARQRRLWSLWRR